MKRILSVIVITLITSFIVKADISRTIYDITLGSNMESAKSVFNEKGLSYAVQDSELGICLYSEKPYFAGIYWDFMIVTFEDNKVYSIAFNKQCDNMLDMVSLLMEAQQLTHNLSEKYAQYEDPRTSSSENGGNIEINYLLSDNITDISFQCSFKKYGKSSMSLLYIDKDMFSNKNSRKTIDEL